MTWDQDIAGFSWPGLHMPAGAECARVIGNIYEHHELALCPTP